MLQSLRRRAAAAEAGVDDETITVREGFARRWWRAISSPFRSGVRPATALEVEQAAVIGRLLRNLADREEEISRLNTSRRILQADVEVSAHEKELLADVIARDRKRVQAEAARFARDQAESEGLRRDQE